MGKIMYVLGLLFIASIICSCSAEESKYENIRKSSLILEYNWPEPSKSLNRLPHPRSCHHFIHTKHDGSHVVKRCHGDKIFDYRSLRCQHKSSAKCWMNIVKKGNMKKIKRPFSCPYPWGLYPDKEDCSLFYNCMGGKVYPRKCPDSTFFDVVERICVHSRKALCAGESDNSRSDRSISQPHLLSREATTKTENSSANLNRTATTIHSKSSEEFDIDSKERSSEEIDKRNRKKSKNKFVTSKLTFITSSSGLKTFRTTGSEGDSSEEKNSSEEKYRTQSKNKIRTPKQSFLSTATANPKLLKKTKTDSGENSSEEGDSSEEKGNKVSTKHKLKFTTSKIQSSTNKNGNSKVIIPVSTIRFTENKRITSSSQDNHSTELPLRSSTIKSLVSTENKPETLINTVTPAVSGKDVDNTEGVFEFTETLSEELSSSANPVSHENLKPVITTVTPEVGEKDDDKKDMTASQHTEVTSMEFISSRDVFSHKNIYSTTKIPFIAGSSTIHPKTTENSKIELTSEKPFSFVCPRADGHFAHPKNKNLFVVCSGGNPIIMKCPESLVFNSHTTSCDYDV